MLSYEVRLKTPTTIHPDIHLGYVHLTVSDLARSLGFYQGLLGFQVHRHYGDTAYLGAGRDDLLVLTERHGAARPMRRTGLYHFAIRLPSRQALAQSLEHLIDAGARLQGGADHLVSEALYLADPDGNGVELYRDRPRSAWRYANGRLHMTTDPLDYTGLLAELDDSARPWAGLHPETSLGHVHLYVAQLPQAVAFYAGIIGLDLVTTLGDSAAFLSAGGYHHHVAVNTWNGVGAPPPPPDAVGLRYFSLQLPDPSEKASLLARLESAAVPYEVRDDGLLMRDPSHNALLFTLADV